MVKKGGRRGQGLLAPPWLKKYTGVLGMLGGEVGGLNKLETASKPI